MIKILGIETSCDETAASVVDENRNILSNVVFTQIESHMPYGGVVPEIASRAHTAKINQVVEKALSDAKTSLDEISAIAVTSGPGLIGGVIVGLMTAKGLASVSKKPLICVNHLEGHALTTRLTNNIEFPFLLLLVSGGHCQFIYASDVGKYKLLGQTHDDAVGEAFDKTAKLLGLGYPGGPAIENLALEGDENKYKFPKPFFGQKNCDFSFSGLKTAVLREIEKFSNEVPRADAANICASFQRTVKEIIIDRISFALEMAGNEGKFENFVLSGGVAANQYIGNAIKEFLATKNINFYAPPISLCTDNAAMIAWAGLEKFKQGYVSDIDSVPRARWPLSEV